MWLRLANSTDVSSYRPKPSWISVSLSIYPKFGQIWANESDASQISGHTCHKRYNQVIKWKNKKNCWTNEWILSSDFLNKQYCSPYSALVVQDPGQRKEETRKSREGKDDEMTFKLVILKYLLKQFSRMFFK